MTLNYTKREKNIYVQDQGQCSSPNIDFENKIKQETLNIEKNICFNPETDKPITIGEIKSVLKILKKEKSSGPDGIINEIFKYIVAMLQ